jgi:hypothetical protein
VVFHILGDLRLAVVHRPLVHATLGIVDITFEKFAMIGIIHDLTDRRAGTFWHHAVDHAFGLSHPSSGATHIARPHFLRGAVNVSTAFTQKSKEIMFIQFVFTFRHEKQSNP